MFQLEITLRHSLEMLTTIVLLRRSTKTNWVSLFHSYRQGWPESTINHKMTAKLPSFAESVKSTAENLSIGFWKMHYLRYKTHSSCFFLTYGSGRMFPSRSFPHSHHAPTPTWRLLQHSRLLIAKKKSYRDSSLIACMPFVKALPFSVTCLHLLKIQSGARTQDYIRRRGPRLARWTGRL